MNNRRITRQSGDWSEKRPYPERNAANWGQFRYWNAAEEKLS